LIFGVSANLLVLVNYKYLFDLTSWTRAHGLAVAQVGSPLLPLGISFFTFTQVGFLIDRRAGVTKAGNLIEYLLFVSFFPHLIAGPILHHREIMPQFRDEKTYTFNKANFGLGLSIFSVGFAKKVLIADWFGSFVPSAFDHPYNLTRPEAWHCVLSYFLQLYFDFSGYSEMALGLARMFNVTFPANFDSPYKAPNVIEFWQRWHMSLTRYVNLYIFNPIALAITRRRYGRGKPANAAALRTPGGFASMLVIPTIVTMILIGVWHGSGLQFFAFGLLHGFYLCIAHAWRLLRRNNLMECHSGRLRNVSHVFSVLLTCLAVLFAQVYFRAHSVENANSVIGAMTFLPTASPAHFLTDASQQVAWGHSDATPPGELIHLLFRVSVEQLKSWGPILLGLLFVWTLPNVLQLFATESPALVKSRAQSALIPIEWRPSPWSGVLLGLLFLFTFMCVTGTTEFLYFRF
jgi:D-alanyl-lipoteichoic acid acyltransferase DltB (MBOAT superfamily)